MLLCAHETLFCHLLYLEEVGNVVFKLGDVEARLTMWRHKLLKRVSDKNSYIYIYYISVLKHLGTKLRELSCVLGSSYLSY